MVPENATWVTSRTLRRDGTTAGIWLFAAAVVAVLVAVLARSGPIGIDYGWDETVYALGAQRWLAGELPYVAIWDHHPVGFVAIFALAQSLVHDPLIASRAVGAVSVVVSALALFGIGRRATGSQPVGFFAMLLYLLAASWPMSLETNAELTIGAFAGIAALLLFIEAERLQARLPLRTVPLLLAGLCFSAALQVKYVAVAEAVVLCGALLCFAAARRTPLVRLGVLAMLLAAAGLSMTALAAAYFWWHGQLPLWLSANVNSNLAYAEVSVDVSLGRWRIRRALIELLPLFVLALPAALPLLLRRRHPALATLRLPVVGALLWLVAGGLDIAIPMKFFDHYFLALVAPLCLLAAAGLEAMFRLRPTRSTMLAGLGALLCVTLWTLSPSFTLHPRAETTETLLPSGIAPTAAIIGYLQQRHVGENDLFIFNYSPNVYLATGTRSPTPYALSLELTSESVSSNGVQPVCEVGRILATKPRFILRVTPSAFDYAPGVAPLLERNLANYHVVFQVPVVTRGGGHAMAQVYERTELGSSMPPLPTGPTPVCSPAQAIAQSSGVAR